jgi:predicted dehydrogenase
MLTGALIGCGWFGDKQLEAWTRIDGVSIAAVCDVSRQHAEALAARYRIPRVYDDSRHLLDAERLDFVDIATRPEQHPPLTRAAALRRIHVLCQKPFAPTLEDARAMIDVCREHGARLMIHENWRWQPWYREMARLVAGGAVGDPFYLHLHHRHGDGLATPPYPRQPYQARMPRFLLYETLIHHVDTAVFLFGEPSSVFCHTARVNPSIAGEDLALLTIKFTNGRVAIVDGNRCAAPDEDGPVAGRARIEGTAAALTLTGDGRITRVTPDGRRDAMDYHLPDEGYRGDSVRATQAHFAECLRTGARFETEGADYLRTFSAIFEAYDSAASGEPRPWPRT